VAIRVVLADDHRLVLDGLEDLFSSEPDITVIARCQTGEEALAALRDHPADVLVLDLRMPGMGGLEVLRVLEQERAALAVALYTVGLDRAELAEAIRLGVRGVVLKETPPGALVECVRALHAGNRWLDDSGDTSDRSRAH
jgi:DNA-binding NarL/FixJ family response regulator